jgi:hypothetical protein
LHDANASNIRDLIRGASKCCDVRRNSCAGQLKQKLLRHRSRDPFLFLTEIQTRSDVFRSNTTGFIDVFGVGGDCCLPGGRRFIRRAPLPNTPIQRCQIHKAILGGQRCGVCWWCRVYRVIPKRAIRTARTSQILTRMAETSAVSVRFLSRALLAKK